MIIAKAVLDKVNSGEIDITDESCGVKAASTSKNTVNMKTEAPSKESGGCGC